MKTITQRGSKLAIPVLLAAFLLSLAAHPARLSAAEWTLQVKLQGRHLEGTPLGWSQQRVDLLARDGQWWDFAPGEVTDFKRVSDRFRPLSQAEMRGLLLAEFGRRYDVSGTGNYLVVHARGQRGQWARRFDDLYRAYVHYFTARGMRPQRPRFPLVAVVFPTQAELLSYARRQGSPLPSGFLGVYSSKTNRILMYDYTATRGNEDLWHVNAETIIHEAAHQMAFNSGQHNRFARPPRWVAEGLATMFEAPGVWNSKNFSAKSDRINRPQLKAFRQHARTRPKGTLADFLSSERMFRQATGNFYAESWALTFFLMETRPRQYLQYLARTTRRKNFTQANSAQRLAEFTAVFGPNLQLLEAHFLRYIEGLK